MGTGKLKNIMTKTENISRTVNQVSSNALKVTDIYNNISNHSNRSKTKEYQEMIDKTNKYEKASDALLIVFFLLYVAIIIATVVLCVTGNDIILRLVGLK